MVISLALKNSDVVNAETLGIACCILFTFTVVRIKELALKVAKANIDFGDETIFVTFFLRSPNVFTLRFESLRFGIVVCH